MESTPGEGTRFDVILPMPRTATPDPDSQADRRTKPPARSPGWPWRPPAEPISRERDRSDDHRRRHDRVLDSGSMVTLKADPLPLVRDTTGVIRVGGTRVSLDSLLASYLAGASIDDLRAGFPELSLYEIHTSIAYYHKHLDEVRRSLDSRRQQAEAAETRIRQDFPDAYHRTSRSQ